MPDPIDTEPALKAYIVEGNDDPENQSHGFWHEVGVAWMHSDAKGMTVKLHSLPISGEIILRVPRPTL
jgi:hypothetical protein